MNLTKDDHTFYLAKRDAKHRQAEREAARRFVAKQAHGEQDQVRLLSVLGLNHESRGDGTR